MRPGPRGGLSAVLLAARAIAGVPLPASRASTATRKIQADPAPSPAPEPQRRRGALTQHDVDRLDAAQAKRDRKALRLRELADRGAFRSLVS